MKFTLGCWEDFCRALAAKGFHSVTAREVLLRKNGEKYLVLKHDVETKVKRAYRIAAIESRYGQRGSYYVQAYLLKKQRNIDLLKKMQQMGHEISYHHDVMDASKGNMENAVREFDDNLRQFSQLGFTVSTVCQHGNPLMERKGYTSNRDFFRSEKNCARYPEIADIMVNFKQKTSSGYSYFSDAGREFHLIYDPINNDVIKSDDKNVPCPALSDLIPFIEKENCIVNMHPHRWVRFAFTAGLQQYLFKMIRAAAKGLIKLPLFKYLAQRFYYLPKKF